MNMPHVASALGVVTVSVGCATGYPRLGGDASSVLREGDDALYYAKAHGRNQVRTGAELGPAGNIAWRHVQEAAPPSVLSRNRRSDRLRRMTRRPRICASHYARPNKA